MVFSIKHSFNIETFFPDVPGAIQDSMIMDNFAQVQENSPLFHIFHDSLFKLG